MKKLLSIMILYVNLGSAQNCIEDVTRLSTYNSMQVLNGKTGEFEKFNKTDKTALQVVIKTEDKIIHFTDKVNNYNKTFKILGCLMAENSLTYECIDLDNERKCSLVFSSTDNTYELTVIYTVNPIVYKVSRNKNTN